ncbi:MAG: YhjD/YihY/BrkB family envelope integrity protein [Acidobacteriota bacterium]
MTPSKLAAARERFRPKDAPQRGWAFRTWAFIRLSLAKARRDSLPIQSAALAFITILSLVPLLASLSYFSAGFFTDRQGELVDLLARILPYTEASITEQLRLFVEHSASLRGFGLIAFLITALAAFGNIEHTINAIWDVRRRRSWRRQMTSFVMLLAWGPILIGATYSAIFVLRQQPAFAPIADSVPLYLITFAMTSLGLTMLNWQVPHTFVHFRHAALGGITSAVLLEGLRASFRLYAEQVPQMSLVYGSFGFALLFMISIQLGWAIVLIGTEVAYCAQHFDGMSRPRREVSSAEGSWLALAAVTLIIDRFRRHEPMTPHDDLAARFGLPTEQLRRTLEPLVRASMLKENSGSIDGYLLSCDPYKTPVDDVFNLYETEQWSVLDDLPPAGRGPLEDLRARLAGAREKATRKLVLTDLLADEAPESDGKAQDAP